MKVRVKFSKRGPVKYVGHLDVMRYFQKAIRRAKIDICYSEGFSPHQIMSFASPLGVGMESDAEYFDMQLNSSDTSEIAMEKLNAQMADGFIVTDYVLLPDDAKKAMTETYATGYSLMLREGRGALPDQALLQEKLDVFLAKETIPAEKTVKKKNKHGGRNGKIKEVVEIDIKPLIYEAHIEEEDGQIRLCAILASQSGNNLNAKVFLNAFMKDAGLAYVDTDFYVTRAEVYRNLAKEDDKMQLDALIHAGEVIR